MRGRSESNAESQRADMRDNLSRSRVCYPRPPPRCSLPTGGTDDPTRARPARRPRRRPRPGRLAAPRAAPRRTPRPASTRSLAQAWELDKQENPLRATATGDHRYGDRLPSMTPADLERRAAAARSQLEALHAIDRAALGPEDRVSYAMFERDLARTSRATSSAPGASRSRATAASTPGSRGSPRRCRSRPSRTTRTTSRGCAPSPRYFDQHVALMREGLRAGFTSPRVALEGYDATMRPHVVDDPEQSVFWKPFTAFPPDVPAGETERLRAARARGDREVRGARLPAPARVLHEGVPARRAHDASAPAELPDGKAYYAWLVKHFTTLDIDARGGPPASAWPRSRASAARWTRSCARRRLPGHLRRVPRVPAHRPALLRQDARGAAEAGVLHRQADGRQAAVALRPAAAPALRRRAGARRPRAEVHRRPLRRRAARRHARRDLLGQHLRPREPPALQRSRR